ncbi:MAG: MerR family transcriptional regulator [Geminicoccaceae bacterium]
MSNGRGSTADGQAFGIGELASMFGVTHRAIRFYEDQGLLAPRRVGKTRIFGDRDRVRLQFILRGKRLGFSLAEIREWLDLYEREDGERLQYRALLSESRQRIADLERQRDDVNEMLHELEALEALALQHLGAAGRPGRAAQDGENEVGHQPRPPAVPGRKG